MNNPFRLNWITSMATTGTTALATCDFYAQIAMLKPPLTAARIWRTGGGELAEVVKLVNTERLNRSEPNGSYGFKSRPQYQREAYRGLFFGFNRW